MPWGSGKRIIFFFHFADQFYNHYEWKSFTRSYALNIPTFSGPQCTHDIRSVCEYLRVAIDYSVQVSLTTQIILSHDDNQTKIVTTANTINTLFTAGSSRIRLQNVPTYINSSASDNQLCDWFLCFSCEYQRVYPKRQLVAPMRKAGDVFGPSLGWFLIAQCQFWIKGGGRLSLPVFVFM